MVRTVQTNQVPWLRACVWLALAACGSLTAAAPVSEPVVPLPQAHAHNDCQHPRPLLDALDHGFCNVEADVYLIDGKLLVAHDLDKVSVDRTLQSLYLEPLRQRVKRIGGTVYPQSPDFTLLIDVKSDGARTYAALRDVLKDYAAMLTVFRAGKTETNAVTVILSGNRPRAMMAADAIRYAAYDGRVTDLESRAPAAFIPWISDNWGQLFRWRGNGPLPDDERARLKQMVDQAHARGRKLRFWATPDTPAVWKTLYEAGVDLLNADDLAGLQQFLLNATAREPLKR